MSRKLFLVLSLFVILNLSGCIVKALHPFYKDNDLVFDQNFLGSWYDQDSSKWEIVQYKSSKGFMKGDSLYKAYRVCLSENNIQNEFIVHMFKLGGDTYLDFYPVMNGDNKLCQTEEKNTDLYNYHIVPTHTLAKFFTKNDSLVYVKWFNEDWLKRLFEQRRIKIAHEEIEQGKHDKTYILTATTGELRKFVLKYGNDPKAFKANWEAKSEDQEKEDFSIILRRAHASKN